jgi:hypothetical protein
MDDKIIKAIDAIFTEYEDTKELGEFKDEIKVYVSEHVQEMLAAGVGEEEAISRALSKLGDVTEAANIVSHKKRREVIVSAYAKKIPIGRKHAIGYALSAMLLLAGLMTAGSVWFGGDRPIAATSTMLPFALASVAGFVFLGLTQETGKRYPMSWRRSLFYVASAALITVGLFVCVTSLWEEPFVFSFDYGPYGYENFAPRDSKLSDALAGGILPFAVPGLALLVFLIATEKDRRKEWFFRQDAKTAARSKAFTLYSASLWFLALGLFVVLGFLIGWAISWTAFIFAGAGQCLIYGLSARRAA